MICFKWVEINFKNSNNFDEKTLFLQQITVNTLRLITYRTT